jgi:hypothetical protein
MNIFTTSIFKTIINNLLFDKQTFLKSKNRKNLWTRNKTIIIQICQTISLSKSYSHTFVFEKMFKIKYLYYIIVFEAVN